MPDPLKFQKADRQGLNPTKRKSCRPRWRFGRIPRTPNELTYRIKIPKKEGSASAADWEDFCKVDGCARIKIPTEEGPGSESVLED